MKVHLYTLLIITAFFGFIWLVVATEGLAFLGVMAGAIYWCVYQVVREYWGE